ncbi:hypothetical protein [Bradyrhizobium sp.]|uniref:hypothetical protein n=1 Tax=Bradyrhizobium sp. TaxID=376 RepID=UPI003BB20A34
MTARKTGPGQPRRIKLWDMDAAPGSTAESLLKVYMASLDGIDRLEARKAELATSAEFTPAGIQKQSVDWAFRNVVPEFEKGRLAIQRATGSGNAPREANTAAIRQDQHGGRTSPSRDSRAAAIDGPEGARRLFKTEWKIYGARS